MALAALQPQGSPAITEMLHEYEPSEVWEVLRTMEEETTWSLRARYIDVAQIEEATRACGARFIIPGDEEWAPTLDDLVGIRESGCGEPPLGLWLLGPARLHELSGAVALVGSRAATNYGSAVTSELAAELSAAGRPIISGLAYGIDAAAHRGALAAGGVTVAVLACGIDEIYPMAHSRLHASVASTGLIVTEAPPGARPQKVSFLARNRIIAALSAGVVVVEAAARSGAKNTASWASALNRTLMSVPGPVTSALSATPHWLLQEGRADLVTCAGDVERLLGALQPELELDFRGPATSFDSLRPELRAIRECISSREVVGVGDVAARVGMPVGACLAGLAELTETGWLDEVEPQRWALPQK